MKKISTLLLLTILSVATIAQNVSNIEAQLTGDNKIAVHYNISGAKFYQEFNVNLYVSMDGGKTFQGPLKEVAGDVGQGVTRGKHTITWDFLNEIPVVEEDMIFDVQVEVIDKPVKKSFFVSYVGNLTTYAGLRIGMIGKLGWYIEGRISPTAFNNASYTYKDSAIVDYNEPGYYEFNGKANWSAYSFVGGLTFQPSKDFFIFAGVGYGKDERLYGIDNFSYEDEKTTGTAWVRDDAISVTGIEFDAGVIYRFGKLLVSGGATVNFKYVNFTAGIGYSF